MPAESLCGKLKQQRAGILGAYGCSTRFLLQLRELFGQRVLVRAARRVRAVGQQEADHLGALLAVLFLSHLTDPLVQFVVGFFAAGVLEFSTSWVMERMFHARWWDYSNIPLNINGRICVPGFSCSARSCYA